MTIEIGVLTAIAGLMLSLATFFMGRIASAKSEGNLLGEMSSGIAHIKEVTEKIESALERAQNRADELDRIANEANIGQRSAHKRIDEIAKIVKAQ